MPVPRSSENVRRRAAGESEADPRRDFRNVVAGDENGRMPTVQHLVRAVIAPLTRTRLFRALAPVMLPLLEWVVARVSRGRVQLSGLLVPSLVLHTTGAKSGEPRDTYLMYTADGRGRAIIAGTTFAQERHPGWTYNLLAHPTPRSRCGAAPAGAGEPHRRRRARRGLGAHRGAVARLPRLRARLRACRGGCSACSRLPTATARRCERGWDKGAAGARSERIPVLRG